MQFNVAVLGRFLFSAAGSLVQTEIVTATRRPVMTAEMLAHRQEAWRESRTGR